MSLLSLIFKGLLLLLLLVMPKLSIIVLHLLGKLLLEGSFLFMSFNLLILSLFSFFGVSPLISKSKEMFSLMFSKTEIDVAFFISCRNLIAFMELQTSICRLTR